MQYCGVVVPGVRASDRKCENWIEAFLIYRHLSLEGEPIHRDAIDPALRPRAMCTCVSWARGPRLVLNL
jgi:hypothetical protein